MKFNFDNTYTSLPTEMFSVCKPTPINKPQLVVFNQQLAEELGIDPKSDSSEELAAIFSGNIFFENAANIAQAYSGHQFGHFTRLGDGRAVLLGEQLTPDGKRFDLQFKGSGTTPYSRNGDGRATLRAMLREYIISEAMHALNIPTSRSLAIVATGEAVYREQVQEGAVLTRVASSHIRVGTFEHLANFCSPQTLQNFTDYTINRHYPELIGSENSALSLLKSVIEKQTDLIVNWLRVGFIHGVMNTDNMTISGETIDYGPCAFMNTYKPETVYSSIDTNGRYAFGNQANIALWNLTRLAESLLTLIADNTEKAIEYAQEVLNTFQVAFEEKYFKMLASKIGIETVQDKDKILINSLLNWMYKINADYTNTFVELMYPGTIKNKIYSEEYFKKWKTDWKNRLIEVGINPELALKTMQSANPVYIPRNNQVEMVLNSVSESGSTQAFEALMEKLSTSYSASELDINYMLPPLNSEEKNYKTYCGT
jgi:uncharacterized protein YdiU (UPF0061 family)